MPSKPKTTATNEEAKPALVPKLRFPEFRGAEGWTERPLKAVAQINPANDGLPESFIYIDLESVEAGKLKAKNRISREGAPSRAQRLVDCGDIIFQVVRPYQRNNLLCEFEDDDDYVASTGYAQLRAKGINHFLYQSIHTDSFVGRVMAKCTGSNYPAINSSDLAEIHLPLPPTPPEQQKIAECLSSVDEVIAAQARELDALKTHKKGLMQQLFPREGETQPRLRFPEFQNAGEWVVKSLEAIAPLQRGFDLPSTEIRPGKVPIVYSNGQKGFHERGMAEGPGLVTGRSGTIGKLHFIESGEYWPHNTSLWVTSFKGHAPKFVYYLYESIGFSRFASGSGVPTLNRNDAHSFETSVPQDPDEQHRIATCLSSLDALIAAETQKHAALQRHKRGLMQQLFPSPEEVEA